jgi:hypothetical protein
MATQSFLDMIKEFGTGLGVPKVDVDKLIEVHRRNKPERAPQQREPRGQRNAQEEVTACVGDCHVI